MFEVFATICLLNAADVCQQVLVPGLSSETKSECESLAATQFEDWKSRLHEEYKIESPVCDLRPESAIEFTEVSEGVFSHRGKISDLNPASRGNISNISFVVGNDSVAVIDTGGSRWVGEQIYYAVRKVSELPISHVILTHMHPDHVFGASVFADSGSKVVGHEKLDRSLADRAQSYQTAYWRLLDPKDMFAARFVATDIAVSDEFILDLGDRELQLNAWNLAHSNSDLTVLDRRSGIMFVGDLVFNQFIPVLDGSLRGWQSVLEKLREFPARMVIPGHGGPVLEWPGSDSEQNRYLDLLTSDARKALDEGLSLSEAAEIIGQSEAGNWSLFEEFNQRNAISVYTELEWE